MVVADMPGPFAVLGAGEVLVIYEGVNHGKATNSSELEITGTEAAIADLLKCGAGRGKECCRFLTVSSKAPVCERFGSMRYNLIFNPNMSGLRNPPEPFPACQIF